MFPVSMVCHSKLKQRPCTIMASFIWQFFGHLQNVFTVNGDTIGYNKGISSRKEEQTIKYKAMQYFSVKHGFK